MVRDQKGMVLVMVLMILLVLVTLGTAISSFSLMDNKVVIMRQNSLKEYYAARGGAEAAATYIINSANTFRTDHVYSSYIVYGENPSLASSRCLNAYNSDLADLIDSMSGAQNGNLGSLPITVTVEADVSAGDYNNALITIESQCRNQTVKVDLTPRTPSGGPDPRNQFTWASGYVYWH